MVNFLAPGVAINRKNQCFVREKPKDHDKLQERRQASTRDIGFGIHIPFTQFEGIPEDEGPLQANGPPPPKLAPALQPQHRNGSASHPSRHSAGKQQVEGSKAGRSGASQNAKQSGGSRRSDGHASQVTQPPERIVVEGGLDDQESVHQSRGQQRTHSSHSSRRAQAPDNRNLAEIGDHIRGNIDILREQRQFIPQILANQAQNADEGKSRSGSRSHGNRQPAQQVAYYPSQERPVSQRVQHLRDEEGQPLRSGHGSQRSEQSARSPHQEHQARVSLQQRSSKSSRESSSQRTR